MNEAAELRAALRESLPAVDQAGAADMRNPAFTFVPPSHAKALDIDSSVVEGIRGAGKSFWWAHLASEAHRRYIEVAFPDIRDRKSTRLNSSHPRLSRMPSSA